MRHNRECFKTPVKVLADGFYVAVIGKYKADILTIAETSDPKSKRKARMVALMICRHLPPIRSISLYDVLTVISDKVVCVPRPIVR